MTQADNNNNVVIDMAVLIFTLILIQISFHILPRFFHKENSNKNIGK